MGEGTPPGPALGRGPTIRIPRWVQLAGLPVLAVLAWLLASTLGHALFLFLTASVIAFMLNPLARDLQRLRLPRGLAVAIVYLLFAAAVGIALVALTTVVVDQTRSAADRIDAYVTEEDGRIGKIGAEQDVDALQAWLDDHGLESIRARDQANDWLDSLSAGEISGYASDALTFARGAAFEVVLFLFSLILIVVISIYMLLDTWSASSSRSTAGFHLTAACPSPNGSSGRCGAT